MKATITATDVDLKPWRKVELGTGLNDADSFLTSLQPRDGPYNLVSLEAQRLLRSPLFKIVKKRIVADVVRVSLEDLSLGFSGCFEQVYAKALSLRLRLCPPELGPQLLLQQYDAGLRDSVYVGMQPIADPLDFRPRIFHLVGRSDLEACDAYQNSLIFRPTRLIFVRWR